MLDTRFNTFDFSVPRSTSITDISKDSSILEGGDIFWTKGNYLERIVGEN